LQGCAGDGGVVTVALTFIWCLPCQTPNERKGKRHNHYCLRNTVTTVTINMYLELKRVHQSFKVALFKSIVLVS
jgi:hypothetical protein